MKNFDTLDRVQEFVLTPEEMERADTVTRPLAEIIADESQPEHALFDAVETVETRRLGRKYFPGIATALERLGAGDTLAVVIRMPEETSECYGETPNTYLKDRNLYATDRYPAFFGGLIRDSQRANAWAYGMRPYCVLQHAVIVPHDGSGTIPDDGRKNNANPHAELELHIDGVHCNMNQGYERDGGRPNRNAAPDIIRLHTVRNNDAPLHVSAPDVSQLSDHARKTLRLPILPLGYATTPYLRPVPVLFGPEDQPIIRYNHGRFANHPGITDEGVRDALREFDEHIESRRRIIAHEAGSIIFLNNRHIMHGRKPFQAKLNGEGRWLRHTCYAFDQHRMRPFLDDEYPNEARIHMMYLAKETDEELWKRERALL